MRTSVMRVTMMRMSVTRTSVSLTGVLATGVFVTCVLLIGVLVTDPNTLHTLSVQFIGVTFRDRETTHAHFGCTAKVYRHICPSSI